MRRHMRSTMPRGLSVYSDTQSTNLRSSGLSGGYSSLSSTSFMRLCRPGLMRDVVGPNHADGLARPERHGDDIAGLELNLGGTRYE